MKRETQLELARLLQAHVKNGTTALAPDVFRNPVAAYSDAARAQLERDRLFRGHAAVHGHVLPPA